MKYSIYLNNLPSILNLLKPDDVVFIKDGTYTNIVININVIGENNKRILIRAENFNKVFINGQSSMIFITGKYITFGNFVFNQGKQIVISGEGNRFTNNIVKMNGQGPLISVYRMKNRIDHNIFSDFANDGVWLEIKRDNNQEDYNLIDHNIFRNRKPGNGNGFETIRIGLSSSSLSNSKTMIVKNLFENCNGELEIISVKSCENIIYKNIIHKSLGTITLRHGNRNIVANNLIDQFFVKETGGIRIIGNNHIIFKNMLKNINGDDTTKSAISINNGIKNDDLRGYVQVTDTKIIENVMINNKFDITLGVKKGSGEPLLPENNIISNNIIFKKSFDPIYSFSSQGYINTTFVGNKYFGYNMGKNFDKNSKLFQPNFQIDNYINNIKEFGTDERIGILDDVYPELTELNIDLMKFYDFTKNKILIDIKNTKQQMNLPTSNIVTIPPLPDEFPILPQSNELTNYENNNFYNKSSILDCNLLIFGIFSFIVFFKNI
jgi:hypothetical protein